MILVSTVIVTYSTIRNSPVKSHSQVLSAVDETNLAIKQVLGFSVGYYGSVLQVTGDSSFARMLAMNYLHSGLVNIANTHPEWGLSLQVISEDLSVCWFTDVSYSMGNLTVTYDLTGLGLSGITYEASLRSTVYVESTTLTNQTRIVVTTDEGVPLINLGKQNFNFYRYIYTNSTWGLVHPNIEPVAFANGTYIMDTPTGVDPYSYMIQVEDERGIKVIAASFNSYTISLTWNSTLYSMIPDSSIVVELLQNGTTRWLGQQLQATQTKPVPPLPVKAIRVNQTINGINCEVPFQIEDWNDNYHVPAGLTKNATIFSNRQMVVFLLNYKVSNVTLWWDGHDTTNQTSYGYTNRYFTGDDPANGVLTSGYLTLNVITSGGNFQIKSIHGTSENTVQFMRINSDSSIYGATPAYVIHHGIVRDILHQEAEWGGGADNCPNLYAHIVLTLPANATYYTYQLRLMFVQSQQDRTITDLCPIKLTTPNGQPQTENGTLNGFPIISSSTGLFYNFSASTWEHHWSQFIIGTKGAGIMFADNANQMLYFFDAIAGTKTGALKVSNSTGRTIEMLPATMAQVAFKYALDVSWHGAIVTFDGTTPIYKEDNQKAGLWILVECPPTTKTTTESLMFATDS